MEEARRKQIQKCKKINQKCVDNLANGKMGAEKAKLLKFGPRETSQCESELDSNVVPKVR